MKKTLSLIAAVIAIGILQAIPSQADINRISIDRITTIEIAAPIAIEDQSNIAISAIDNESIAIAETIERSIESPISVAM